MNLDKQFEAVNQAFSKQSDFFDEIYTANPISHWMRIRVREHVLGLIKPKSHILELNAGTGLDAVFFASKGHSVYATDISEGMVGALKTKIDSLGLGKMIEAHKLSYTDLGKLKGMQFDYIFSNFGGLNCVPDLQAVIGQFKRLLKPGGIATLVIMPKISPWELATLLKGNPKLAFRRLKRNGAISNIEGVGFISYYFNPVQVARYFGSGYSLIKLQGLCSLVPPPYHQNFLHQYPKLYRFLIRLEENVACKRFFNSFADQFILSMEYKIE